MTPNCSAKPCDPPGKNPKFDPMLLSSRITNEWTTPIELNTAAVNIQMLARRNCRSMMWTMVDAKNIDVNKYPCDKAIIPTGLTPLLESWWITSSKELLIFPPTGCDATIAVWTNCHAHAAKHGTNPNATAMLCIDCREDAVSGSSPHSIAVLACGLNSSYRPGQNFWP